MTCDTLSGTSSINTLPGTVTDYMAESVCGILEIQQQPPVKWDSIPLPELLWFIQKVTKKANIDVQTAIAALVLVNRLKRRLPKAAHGEYGTYHKIFLTSLLIASKEFMPKTKEEEEEEKEESENSLDSNTTETDNANDTNDTNNNNEISNAKDINNVDSDTNSNLSVSPSSSIISTTPSSTIPSDDEQDDDILFRDNSDPNQPRNGFNYKLIRPTINRKLSVISGLYDTEEVERMEREFIWRLNGDNKVTDKDIRDYVEDNRHALGICE